MRRYLMIMSLALFLICLPVAIFFVGCGEGDSGSEGSGALPDSSSNQGTVALLLADGPADEYDHIWIWVTEISLIPAEGNETQDPVVIFEAQDPDGYKFDLLDLRDQDFLFTVRRVNVGSYKKIRLRISDIQADGNSGECNDMEIKLPGGKIDLNPRGGFEVVTGETLSIRLDINANESIKLHTAGHSGRCIFRPVVFVDIDVVEAPLHCPRILTGIIDELVRNDEDEIIGFKLALDGDRGLLDVNLMDDVVIFDGDGLPAGPNALVDGQTVRIRGRLDAEGHLQASLVVIGDVIVVKGRVESSVDQGRFPLALDPGEELTGERVNVEVADETLVIVGCDEKVDSDVIQAGMTARVVGKYSTDDHVLRAVAVLLQPREISGELVSVTPSTEGSVLTIQSGDEQVDVFLPQDIPPYLQGDGKIPLDLLSNLVGCEGREVRVVLNPEKTVLTAEEIRVQHERLDGTVESINESSRTLVINGETVLVRPDATILDLSDGDYSPVGFHEINIGDELECFGLNGCSEDVNFYAFVILIEKP